MKTIIITSFLFLSIFLNAQENKNYPENSTLISKVGTLCVETTIPSPCAGAEIYLELSFKKDEVEISEKHISTCDKETTINLGKYKWVLLENNEVKIDYNPSIENYINQEIEFSIFMKNLKFRINDGKLIGEKDRNNRITTYVFMDTK